MTNHVHPVKNVTLRSLFACKLVKESLCLRSTIWTVRPGHPCNMDSQSMSSVIVQVIRNNPCCRYKSTSRTNIIKSRSPCRATRLIIQIPIFLHFFKKNVSGFLGSNTAFCHPRITGMQHSSSSGNKFVVADKKKRMQFTPICY